MDYLSLPPHVGVLPDGSLCQLDPSFDRCAICRTFVGPFRYRRQEWVCFAEGSCLLRAIRHEAVQAAWALVVDAEDFARSTDNQQLSLDSLLEDGSTDGEA